MIAADDSRHGTNRGYNAGCHEECCRVAHAAYRYKLRSKRCGKYVDATGTHRRIRALAALGHTQTALSRDLGFSESWASKILQSSQVHTSTAAAVSDLYERWSMVVPTGPLAGRERARAARLGWAPPLAWDDIDRDAEPTGIALPATADEVDEVAVQRRMSGDTTVRLTKAERHVLAARWAAAGRSLAELERVHGINPHRELKEAAA